MRLDEQRAKDLCSTWSKERTPTQIENLSWSNPWENAYLGTQQLISEVPDQIKKTNLTLAKATAVITGHGHFRNCLETVGLL